MKTIEVEVVFALTESQTLHRVALSSGSTARQAIEHCGMAALFDASPALKLACFGRPIPGSHVVLDGDRIEVLRPLTADPKDQRHARVKADRRTSARRR